MSEAQPPVPSTGKRSSKRAAEASDPTGRPVSKNNNDDEWIATVAGLNYSQARTSMDLAIAQLQSEDLEVEQMATLYQQYPGLRRPLRTVAGGRGAGGGSSGSSQSQTNQLPWRERMTSEQAVEIAAPTPPWIGWLYWP